MVDLSSSGGHKNGETTYFLNCKVGFRFDCEIGSSLDVGLAIQNCFWRCFHSIDYTGVAQQVFEWERGKG